MVEEKVVVVVAVVGKGIVLSTAQFPYSKPQILTNNLWQNYSKSHFVSSCSDHHQRWRRKR